MPRHGNRSIVTGVSLLKVIAGLGHPASLSEIASAAGMTPTRAHRYLLGLTRSELVEHDPSTQRYDLGAQIVELGILALGRTDAIRLAGDTLIELARSAKAASLITVWGSNGPTVVRWEQAELSSAIRIREGRSVSLLRSSAGHVFLTFLPKEIIETILQQEIATSRGEESDGQIVQRIEQIRSAVIQNGVGIGIGEEEASYVALSAPVFDAYGKLVLCISIVSIVGRLDPSVDGRPADILKEVAGRISRRLGAGVQQRLVPANVLP